MRHKAIMAGAALMLAATPALGEDWDFVLTNSSGKEIKKIELSPAGTGSWAATRAEEGASPRPVKSGARATVHFDKGASECRYDIKATFADDATETWSNINICNNSYVTVRYANGKPTFAAN